MRPVLAQPPGITRPEWSRGAAPALAAPALVAPEVVAPAVVAPAVVAPAVVAPAVRAGVRFASVDEQLARLEARLVAEAGGDPAAEREVLAQLALARARFEGASVRRFLPILIEREVRRRLSAAAGG